MLEIIAVIFTLVSVWLTRKQNIWCWATGIVGTICYYFIFKHDQSWGNMLLQFVFLAQSIYGWINWGKADSDEIEHSDGMYILMEGLFALLIFTLVYFATTIMEFPLSVLDISTTALSILGMYLIATKKLEAWYFWALADVLYIIFFLTTGHILSAILYVIFLINAYFGYKEWKNSIKVPTY